MDSVCLRVDSSFEPTTSWTEDCTMFFNSSEIHEARQNMRAQSLEQDHFNCIYDSEVIEFGDVKVNGDRVKAYALWVETHFFHDLKISAKVLQVDVAFNAGSGYLSKPIHGANLISIIDIAVAQIHRLVMRLPDGFVLTAFSRPVDGTDETLELILRRAGLSQCYEAYNRRMFGVVKHGSIQAITPAIAKNLLTTSFFRWDDRGSA